MLQQTRVETVTPYFERWIARFPTLESLAEADEEEVLNLWAGLGYYSRARRLHASVREVLARYDGVIPESADELETLPGIGAYTAGAVASIAFGSPVPAVDGNVRRVLARLTDIGAPTPAELQRWAADLVDPHDPGGFNQALMELGSQICIPRRPRCELCPVSGFCAAREAGTEQHRPTPPKRRSPPLVQEAVAVLLVEDDGGVRTLLRRRPPEGLLAGMWEFPGITFEMPADSGSKGKPDLSGTRPDSADPAALAAADLAKALFAAAPVSAGQEIFSSEVVPMAPFQHTFSHRIVRYSPFIFRGNTAPTHSSGGRRRRKDSRAPGSASHVSEGSLRWVNADEADRLPLPAAQRTLASRVWTLGNPLKPRGAADRLG